MEFPFNLDDILPGRITVLDNRDSFSKLKIYDLALGPDCNKEGSGSWSYTQSSNAPWDIKVKKRKERLEIVLDEIGIASAQAQDLHSTITTFKKLISSSQQRIYTIRDVSEPRRIIGMLKVGTKRLFVCDDAGAYHEVDPLCVLDFYIHESKQRCGFGHELFDAMLKAEGLDPAKLAIDRPSFKCLAFLEKHYNLKQPSRQNNNFVIYPGFLTDRLVLGKQCSSSTKQKNSLMDASLTNSDSLNCVKVAVSPKEIKNKTFSSSTGRFLNWDDTESNSDSRKKPQSMTGITCRQAISYCWNKGEKSWGVNEALHSYSVSDGESHGWCNNPTNCELTPINTVSTSTQKKWNEQLQSSWNILGVKPLDYSPFYKK
ncbi:alpha-tubulin N-acetyltransferase 1-like isoform X2 [Argiope bruennichi]|uniref:alpha-tubulin N-acetyltransferase 1-like isoform X2 n=1 Tax=Argiope bruennichi TaxID=94029 RepID=UPI0024944DBE|nr:alpha-tubulin N-acetyltransferase 1-like isoform X2 [Argiope bruennichi]